MYSNSFLAAATKISSYMKLNEDKRYLVIFGTSKDNQKLHALALISIYIEPEKLEF